MMTELHAFNLANVHTSWAIQHPAQWMDMWQAGRLYELSSCRVNEVLKLNEAVVRHACAACQSGDKKTFDAWLNTTRYSCEGKDVWGKSHEWVGQSHLEKILHLVVLRLMKSAPEGLLSLKAWGVLDDGAVVSKTASMFGIDEYYSQNRWGGTGNGEVYGGHALRPDELLFCLCKTSPKAEEVSRLIFPEVKEAEVWFARAVGHLDAYGLLTGSQRKLSRMVKRLGEVSRLPESELEQWATLNAVFTETLAHGFNKDLKTICAAFNRPFSEAGALIFLSCEIKKNPGLGQCKSIEETYLYDILKGALVYGSWDFSRLREKEPEFEEKNRHLVEGIRNLVLNVRLKQRHADVLDVAKQTSMVL